MARYLVAVRKDITAEDKEEIYRRYLRNSHLLADQPYPDDPAAPWHGLLTKQSAKDIMFSQMDMVLDNWSIHTINDDGMPEEDDELLAIYIYLRDLPTKIDTEKFKFQRYHSNADIPAEDE